MGQYLVKVLRDCKYGDHTNGGVSANHDRLTVVDGELPSDPNTTSPEVMILYYPRLCAIPIFRNGEHSDECGPMFGGNYIYSNDSRFPSDTPIPLHDRFETWDQYNALST